MRQNLIQELRKNRQNIIELYQSGQNIIQIGTMFNCSPALVYKFLEEEKLIIRRKFVKLSNIEKCKDEILRLFNDEKWSINKIHKYLNVGYHPVSRFLKKNGLDSSSNSIKPLLEDKALEVIELYKKHGATYIANIFNCDVSAVYTILRKYNIAIEKVTQYNVDEKYFEQINSADKAYWLGWLYADGYISEEEGYFRLSLQERDGYIVEKFKEDIQYDGPLVYKNLQKYAKEGQIIQNQRMLAVNRRKIVNDLVKLGCKQGKSLTCEFPTEDQVPNEFLGDFLRGYFDGDGCIYTNRCDMCGSEAFLTSFQDKLSLRECRIFLPKNNKIHRIFINKRKDVLYFLRFIYDNDKFCLKRKKDKYLEIQPLKSK